VPVGGVIHVYFFAFPIRFRSVLRDKISADL
jgi:hypothetical protein